jgi:hypothetical protein
MIRRLGTRAAQNGSPVATGSTMKLPLGRHTITYKAKDANGNEAQATTVVIVQSGTVLCGKKKLLAEASAPFPRSLKTSETYMNRVSNRNRH